MSNPLTQHEIISGKITELQEKILAKHPQMPLLLSEIHKSLKNNPAVATLLAEEDIARIVNGLEVQTNTSIAQSMTSAKGSKTKALSKVTSNDLGFD